MNEALWGSSVKNYAANLACRLVVAKTFMKREFLFSDATHYNEETNEKEVSSLCKTNTF